MRADGGARPDGAMAARRERMTAERAAIRAVLTTDQAATFDRIAEKLERGCARCARRGAPPR